MKNKKKHHYREHEALEVNNYYDLLSSAANSINWLMLSILSIIAITFFAIFQWHFGSNASAMYTLTRVEAELDSTIIIKNDLRPIQEKNEILVNIVNVPNTALNDSTRSASKLDTSFYFLDTVCLKEMKEKELLKKCPSCHHIYKENNSSECVAQLLKMKESIATRIAFYREEHEKDSATVPFVNLTMSKIDFLLVCQCIGLVFIIWLSVRLSYVKNALKELFNVSILSTEIDRHSTLAAPLFYIILPLSENRRYYKYVEVAMLLFLLSALSVIVSDFFDIYVWTPYNFKTVSESAGYKYQLDFILVREAILCCLVIFSTIVIIYCAKVLKSIRNLLLLLKWQSKALFPAVYEYYNKLSLPIEEGVNHIGYRVVDQENLDKLYLRIKAKSDPENPNPKPFFKSAKVDLAQSLKTFYANYPEHAITLTAIFDEKRQKYLTTEEVRMKEFFVSIFENNFNKEEIVELYFKSKETA